MISTASLMSVIFDAEVAEVLRAICSEYMFSIAP